MELCSSSQRTSIIEALPIEVKTTTRGSRITALQYQNLCGKRRTRPLVVVAGAKSRGFKHNGVRTPRKPSSPEGKFLSAVLQNQRHLFQFALSEQLKKLASKRNEASAQKKPSSDSMEFILHRRIAEMKDRESQTAIEDVMYMSVVHSFLKFEIPTVAILYELISMNELEICPSEHRKLESIHSIEIQKMVRKHVATVLHMIGKSSLCNAPASTNIDRLDLGRIYASSVMYGYFLKSICFRREMDLSLARSHEDFQSYSTYFQVEEIYACNLPSLRSLGLLQRCDKLSSYVKSFNSESLQRCARLKSKEAANVIEKHTWALFGDKSINQIGSDREIVITISSIERLVLEAVAFGSFLWDVERSVDSAYTLY